MLPFGYSGLYFTLVSGTPVPTSLASGSTLYLTPDDNDQLSLYDGTSWGDYQTSEISAPLSILASGTQDVFVGLVSGVPTIQFSAAWTSSSVRADALTRQDGVWVKASDHTQMWAGTIQALTANTVIDGPANRMLYNARNQRNKGLYANYLPSFTYTSNTVRQWNGTPNTTSVVLSFVAGDASDTLVTTFGGRVSSAVLNSPLPYIGIGFNSNTVDGSQTPCGIVPSFATVPFQGIQTTRKTVQALGGNSLFLLQWLAGSGGPCTWDNGFISADWWC